MADSDLDSDVLTRNKQTRVVSANVSVFQRLAEIWRSRELLVYLVRTEIKVKYKNSFLGLLWSMLSPAMTLAVYTLVFGVLLKNGIPNFVIFLFAGLLLWNFFSTGVTSATGVVVNNAGLVKKVSFPREILALAAIGSAGVFFFFQACVMAIFMLALHMAAGLAADLAAPGGHRSHPRVRLGLGHLPGGCKRLPPGHPAPGGGPSRCRLVLGVPDRLLLPGLPGRKVTGRWYEWVYFLNPMTPMVMTFQRVLYDKPGLVT